MAARNSRRRHRKQRGRFSGFYKLLCVLVIFAAILVGCVVFFKVNAVTAQGMSRYTEAEIVAASGVKNGDNLFLINKPRTALRIQRSLPYVENVSISRKLPDVLEVRVTETEACACLQADGAWWLVDAAGKVLEQGDESLAQSWPVITGLVPLPVTVGAGLAVEPEQQVKLACVTDVLTALRDRELTGLTGFVDVTAENNIYFGYGRGLTVVMPLSDDFSRRTLALQRILLQNEEQGRSTLGTLYLTNGDERANLLPEQWLPAGNAGQQEGDAQNGGTQQPAGAGDGTGAEPTAAPVPTAPRESAAAADLSGGEPPDVGGAPGEAGAE